MKDEKVISQFWESNENLADAESELEFVRRRMDSIDEDDFSDRANKIKRLISELHADMEAEMEEQSKMRGLTQ